MIGKDINRAVQLLQDGQLVAIPTETVYGLAGHALNLKAVAQIFKVKNRPSFDPLIIHLPYFSNISPYIKVIPEAAAALADAFMPGPLTLLLEKSDRVPDLVTAGSSLVAVRIPAHPVAHQLLTKVDFPLAAPSANPFGYISPTTAQHVDHQLGQQIPYILDGGPCEVGLESTIVGFPGGQPTVYRKGGIAVEALEAVAGPMNVKQHSTSNPHAPGMLKSHYAPRIPLVLGTPEDYLQQYAAHKIGCIRFRVPFEGIPENQQLVLSPSGDDQEAARRLFAGMRQLDGQALSIIVAELLPEAGLGRAVNDRLRRAAAR
ncbi:MAG: L-threonylcarbamoyladenylate synthase [Phaeodactylibacter sp.]|uniref:L-threonylcarbamoyladenylate synthase n=1 Tax=Phaeodactylibacter sp. TaxID=1940289 RepID=UPI0032ED81B7